MRKFLISLIIILGFGASTVHAQVAKLQSIFIYNFIKQIEWPASVNSGDFVIGVLGSTPLYAELENLARTKKVDNRKITILKFNSISDYSPCHIVFIPANEEDKIVKIKSLVKQYPTLIIAEKEGASKEGAIINFVVRDYKQKFELNESSAAKQNLKVSSYLKKLAIPVNY